MASDRIRIAPRFALDADYVGGGTFALLAKKGAGKTYTARVLAEEFWRAGIPFAALDPMGAFWGLRANAAGTGAGIPVTIFGGRHGDLPLERTAGALMADLLVDERLSMVLDLKELGSRAAERQFARDFLEQLYRRNEDLVHLLVDEADLFAPQKPQAGDQPLLGVTENIVRRGRNVGIGITLITQRPAVLNKDVLTQVDGLVAGRITGYQDREAIDDWVRGHGDQETAREVKGTLAGLANGECWWWVPELDVLKRVQVREARTFDSSPTRKRSSARREPKTFADVDLEALRDRMAVTIERAAAEDPKALRRRMTEIARESDDRLARVRQLERELAERPAVEPERVEVPVLADGALEQLRAAVAPLEAGYQRIAGAIEEASRILDQLDSAPPPAHPAARAPAVPARPRAVTLSPATAASADGGEVQIKAGARRMLQAAAGLHPMRLTRAQIATLAKVKKTGGTFSTYLGVLKQAGYLDEDATGLAVTQTGFDYLGEAPPAPATAGELRRMWRDRLKAGARRMLDILIDEHPGGLTRGELAERAEVAASGGTFSTYLGMLRSAGLIEESGGQVRAGDVLFLGAAA